MADKYLYNNAGTITEKEGTVTSAGAGDAGKIPALDGAGKLDSTMMPTGTDIAAAAVTASENLADGDFVNVWNSTGAKARKADATVAGKEANGFVKAAVTSGQPATVFFDGINDHVTGQTPGKVFLSTSAGLATSSAPSGSGNSVQEIGSAISATAIAFRPKNAVVLA